MSFENTPFFDLFLLALIAGFFIYRLYKVLGQRSDIEKKIPWKNFKDFKAAPLENPTLLKPETGEVKDLAPAEIVEETPLHLEEGVAEIKQRDPTFSYTHFKQGALTAFQTILKSYASSNRAVLESLLEESLYKGFEEEMDKREQKGHVLHLTLLKEPTAEVVAIKEEKDSFLIEVKFVSEQMRVLKDKEGTLLEKSPRQGETIKEVWTFGRPFEQASAWKLIHLEPAE